MIHEHDGKVISNSGNVGGFHLFLSGRVNYLFLPLSVYDCFYSGRNR